MTPSLLLALCRPAFAGGQLAVEAFAGGRSAPQLTAQGASELNEAEPASALAALRMEAESASHRGAWLGGTAEAWSYLPDPELSSLRIEPRGGWRPELGDRWQAELGGRYALEAYPWSPRLDSGRAEATGGVGPVIGPLRLGVEADYVRRDFLSTRQWSFQTVEGGLLVGTAPTAGGLRATLRLGGQYNDGFTLDTAGQEHPATGIQARVRADLGWSLRAVDLHLGWRLIRSLEGDVEDAARPQFTPIGQYADDADALSAGGFLQNRFDLSAIWSPSPSWTLGLDGLLRLRKSDAGQQSASIATTAHLQARVARSLSKTLTLSTTAGLTRLDLVSGEGAIDLAAWVGLRWQPARPPVATP